MWERADLKQRAKNVLRGSYWKAFLVSIVMGLLGGTSGGSGGAGATGNLDFNGNHGGMNLGHNFGYFGNGRMPRMALIFASIFTLVFLIILILRIVVGFNLEVGGRRYFIQGAQGDVNMGYLGYGFKQGRYFNIVKTMLWKGLMTFLWGLLFIIPGIIKSYAYSMVPYILADNPEIDYKRALQLSDQMTKGDKLDIFVLELSFLGWYLLGALLCGLGVIFVVPYEHATRGELYLDLRKRAIENGLCDYQELNFVRELKTTGFDIIDEEF